ncbi:MAG: crosslink repair DNA glycosylase YcaQ family protein [Actinomycetota bacterium]|nr:crosslink repair DNA glycosylase YcaQ family protein [Actinomycetota bacterium]MEE3126314.1 crosslink repair DNA glycosylase YcaQ family protein [Actinomycetota bacterium]
MLELTRDEARRIAVRAQLLALPRPDDVVDVVAHLGALQLDPTKAVAPSAHLVLWSRVGSDYHRADLEDALTDGRLVEIGGMARTVEQAPLHRAVMAAWPGPGAHRPWHDQVLAWIADNAECRRDILETLRQEGPLTAPELPSSIVRPWRSSGWTDDKSVLKLLDMMAARGEVVVVGRAGPHRLWDLSERVLPDDPVPPLEEALAELARRRLRALGIARGRAAVTPGEPNDVGETGSPARVDGVRGTWRVDAEQLKGVRSPDGWAPRTALLSPLDRLVLDRSRMATLFDFDYQLEMYKPAAQRRFGYWALPVLHGDRLVGKVDCTTEPAEGVLRVDAVHEDHDWPEEVRAAVHAEIECLAGWLGVEPLLMPGVRR